MFTGIVQAVGEVAALEPKGADLRLKINAGKLEMEQTKPGDSICVSGVCLTLVEYWQQGFWADVSGETLHHTTLGELRQGNKVNLEKALTLSAPLGGHIVTGHVDGVGVLQSRHADGRSERICIGVPDQLSHYVARKGSICVDGVSLTVNVVEGSQFEVNIVPHTLEETTLGAYSAGHRVNLEVDIIARYLERLLLGQKAVADGEAESLTRDLLARHGFIKEQ